MKTKKLRLALLSALIALTFPSCGGRAIPETDIEPPALTSAAEVTSPAEAEISPAETSESKPEAEAVSAAEESSSTAEEAASSTAEPEPKTGSKAEAVFEKLSLREKVGQLFIFRFDGMLYNDSFEHWVRYLDDDFRSRVEKYPIGGFLTMGANISSPEQLKEMNRAVTEMYPTVKPFICTDEEGGDVARLANSGVLGISSFPNMGYIGAGGDPEKAFEAYSTIGGYLKEYGFNLDLAPVADVNTNPNNIVIGQRAFGSDPETASHFVSRAVDGLHEGGVMSCLKHFPGHGDTAADSHYGAVTVDKTWEEMLQCELIPFIGSMDKTDMIMTAHIAVPKVTGDDTPASLSYTLLTEKLRNELGYEGVIITDSLGMGAVSKYYSSEECCIAAINAGVDLLLKPVHSYESFEAVLKAAEEGEISEERINESVMRILRLKEKYGMLNI